MDLGRQGAGGCHNWLTQKSIPGTVGKKKTPVPGITIVVRACTDHGSYAGTHNQVAPHGIVYRNGTATYFAANAAVPGAPALPNIWSLEEVT